MSYLTNPLTISRFEKSLHELIPNLKSERFLLAVSGGVDSMVLSTLCLKAGLSFEIAHVNYHLREEQSDLDQFLVSEFCNAHNIPFHLYSVGPKDQKPQGSIQLWARKLRYDFFKKVQHERKLPLLFTAHHIEDQLETFLINLSRGSGLKGLSGIPANQNEIVRPLLAFSKNQLYDFAKENKVAYREDQSNQSDHYLRNRIRHHVIPALKETNENFLENFHRSLEIIAFAKDYLKQEATLFLTHHGSYSRSGKLQSLNLKALNEKPKALQYEILSSIGFSSPEEMQKLFISKSGSTFAVGNQVAILNRQELLLTPSSFNSEMQEEFCITDAKGSLSLPAHLKDEFESFGALNWQFKADQIEFPLKIRHKKTGDFFYPVGMMGKKKISKFYKDEKLSILAKSKIWILCDARDQILGILPFRQDRRFRAENHYHNVYSFLSKNEN